MPTVLLEQIIEILNNLYAGFGNYLNDILTSLDLTKEDVSAINDNISSILDKADNISDNTDTLAEVIAYINNKLTTTNSSLDAINLSLTTTSGNVATIKDNTGAIISPVSSIKTNTDRLVTNSNTISNNTDSISNNIGSISASAGSTASNTNQIATNTLNTYNKVVTMASDTTQMRSDNQTIIGVLNDMYDIMASTPASMPADHVTYDPSQSGLIATNVQDALDEVVNRPIVYPTASDVSYSNTSTGLNANNVQDAIDEIENSLSTVATTGSYTDLTNKPAIPVNSDFALSGLSDTDITTPSAGQVLAYDSNGKVVNKTLIKTTKASGTTTNSGALPLPTGVNAENILACVGTDGTIHAYAFPRGTGDGYLQVFHNYNNTMVAYGSENVSFLIIYY